MVDDFDGQIQCEEVYETAAEREAVLKEINNEETEVQTQ